MSHKDNGNLRKSYTDGSVMKGTESIKLFMKFKHAVEKEIEDAILRHMKAFRDDILRTKPRK